MLTAGDPVWDPLLQRTLYIGLLYTVSFSFATPPATTWTPAPPPLISTCWIHWTLCLPRDPWHCSQPCLFSSFGFHDILSPYRLPLPPPFLLALSELLLLRYFQEALPLTAGFTLSQEHCPCLLLSQFISFLRCLFHAWSFYWHANNPSRRLYTSLLAPSVIQTLEVKCVHKQAFWYFEVSSLVFLLSSTDAHFSWARNHAPILLLPPLSSWSPVHHQDGSSICPSFISHY